MRIMPSFDFITDESFRYSLESDYAELIACVDNKAYKSAHVMAGSIIETILIDYLISDNIVAREKALRMDFGEAIKLCLEKDIISEKTGDLCSVIKSYRNLIHPGRVIRRNESISSESADVAKALVIIVVKEVEKKRRENYGYTAEQIVSKLEKDPGANSIISNLLSKTNPLELERLMFKILPERFLFSSEWGEHSEHFISSYKECFRTAFNLSSRDIKIKVAERHAKAIKEDSGDTLVAYGTIYFRAEYFEYMNDFDLNLVKTYQLTRLGKNVDLDILTALAGIGIFLDKNDINAFIDPLLKTIIRKDNPPHLKSIIRIFLTNEMHATSPEIDELILGRVDYWIELFAGKSEDVFNQLVQVKSDIIPEIPF